MCLKQKRRTLETTNIVFSILSTPVLGHKLLPVVVVYYKQKVIIFISKMILNTIYNRFVLRLLTIGIVGLCVEKVEILFFCAHMFTQLITSFLVCEYSTPDFSTIYSFFNLF